MERAGGGLITIKNTQRKIKINRNKTKLNIYKMLEISGYPDFDIGVWFTTNKTIREYSKKFRKKDKPTDILSFPYHDKLKPGQKIVVKEPEDKNLGDIIISVEFAKKEAQEKKLALEKYLQILLAHGIAHLLGFDHKTEKQYKAMQEMERRLLES